MTSIVQSDLPRFCEHCVRLRLTRTDFESPPNIPEGRYHSIALHGTIGELRARESQCPLCWLLLHALSRGLRSQPEVLSDWNREWEAEWLQNTFEYDPLTDEAQEMYGSGLYPRLKSTTSSSDYGVQLVDDTGTTKLLRARLIPERIDFDRIKSWIRKCRGDHGPQCADTYLLMAAHPSSIRGLIVIDVVRKCLASLPELMEYVALSYVWGKNNFLVTVKSNFEQFQADEAFERVKLAKTIRDAMGITANLGYRFLWVDSLCIIQDDEERKKEMIENMDAVYGNAALTIVAASGSHAGAGILSSRSMDDLEAEAHLIVQNISPGFSLGVLPFLDGELMDSIHAQRGWTYQEGCLSARCLVFLNGFASFVCRTSVWREDIMAESADIQPFDGANTLGKTASEWPLRRYADHKALACSMDHTRMWWGLLAAAFDWAILWQPPWEEVPKRRPGFPTWSWTGWIGTINMAQDNWSELDQRWLLERTWIEWHIVDDNRTEVPVWNPRRNGAKALVAEEIFKSGHVGGDEDEDEDEEFMPRYGTPTESDVFGRDSARSFAALRVDVTPRTSRQEKIGPFSPGTLSFHTFVASRHDKWLAKYIQNGMAIIQAFSAGFQTCGFLRLNYDSQREERCRGILVILSYAAPGSTSMSEIEDLWREPAGERFFQQKASECSSDGEDVLGTWHAWNWLNVMLVNPQRGDRNGNARLGLGIVHRDALKFLNVTWSHVVLS